MNRTIRNLKLFIPFTNYNMKLTFVLYFSFLFSLSFASEYSFDYNTISSSIETKVLDIIEKSAISSLCSSDLRQYVSDLFLLKPWALKMFDASGKIASGFAYGNHHFYGSFDECLSINENNIIGKYCAISLQPKGKWAVLYLDNLMRFMKWPKVNYQSENLALFYYIVLDVCIPKSCAADDVVNVWITVNTTYQIPFGISVEEDKCIFEGKINEQYTSDVFVFLFFGFVLLVVILSTVYDIYSQSKQQKSTIFVAFSLYTNTKSLLSVDFSKDTLICLYGIRVLSMLWILVGHMNFAKGFNYNNNIVYGATEWRESLGSTFILAIPYAVDGFFAISGILVVYVYLKRVELSKVRLLPFYLHRYFRLFPALFATVLFSSAVFKYLPGGPRFPAYVKFISKSCHFNWWYTFTFTQNWAPESVTLCMDQAWYLTIDTQLYLLAPLLLFNIRKHTRKVLTTMAVLSIFSIIYTFYRVFELRAGYLLVFELQTIRKIYKSIFLRMPSWLLGAFYGYLIYSHRLKRIKISRAFNYILWIVSLTTMLCLILYHNIYAKSDYSPIRSGFMNTLGKTFWCFCVSNLIYSLSTGHGHYVNAFLGHPVFVVLAKLSYCIYLVQMWVIYWIQGYQRQARYYSNFQIFYEFWGDFSIILFAATVLHLSFERPFTVLMERGVKGLRKANRKAREHNPLHIE